MNINYSAKEVASILLELDKKEKRQTVSHLKLQKLLYFVQGWYLAFFEKALFNEDFQAWVHGPVLVEIYPDFKHLWLAHKIENNPYPKSVKDKGKINFIKAVFDRYKKYSGRTLEYLSHTQDPWKKNYVYKKNNIIPKEEIKNYFYKTYLN